MNEIFVPYAIAAALALKGFERDCIAFYATKYDQTYNEKPLSEPTLYTFENPKETAFIRKVQIDVYAPTWEQVINWFKEKHQISIDVDFINLPGAGWYGYSYEIRYTSKERPIPADFGTFTPRYDTRPQALIDAFVAALNVI